MFAILIQKSLYIIARIYLAVLGLFSKRSKNAIKENLTVVQSPKIPSPKDVKSVSVYFTKNIVEFICFPFFDDDWVNKNVRVTGLEYIDQCLSRKEGVILGSAHLGNWEIGCLTLGLKGYPINTVYWNHKNRHVDDFYKKRRINKNIGVISVNRRIGAKCMQVLRKGELLALAIDRMYGESGTGTVLQFFGKRVELPRGPAVLSLKTGAPIVPTFCVRLPRDRFNLVFCEPRYYRAKEIAREDPVTFIMNDCIKVVESFIAKYPLQWCMFHKVFAQQKLCGNPKSQIPKSKRKTKKNKLFKANDRFF